jgi:predicted nucleic acid-binding protein
MAMFPAFLDTCTLYGAYLCDSLLRLAEAGTYRPLWSADVLDELERALVARGLERKAVTHRIGEMRRAFPDAEVRGYENLVETMTCDPKDSRVLAAAVRSDAAVLVTFNIGDFLPCSFGFRPKRSPHDALQVFIEECGRGRRWGGRDGHRQLLFGDPA